jgi:3'-5' exoribonuclease
MLSDVRLPRIRQLSPDSAGPGYFLCAGKENRVTRGGEAWLQVVLQDVTGQVIGKLFPPDSDRYRDQFEAGEFVRAEGRVNINHGRAEIMLSAIRRIDPVAERASGFREEDCVPSAPRPIDEMWEELTARIDAVTHEPVRVLLRRIAMDHEAQLRLWPAALTVHHAYRGGLLEHIVQVAQVADAMAGAYGADADIVFAGALLHDIGKLRELEYDLVPSYSREGNLIGHIGLGLVMVREAAAGIAGLTADRLGEVEHLVASHHGSREFGALTEPRTVEAFILAAADDLDAKIHQVRRSVAEDDTDSEFTAYHPRLRRTFLKPSKDR